MRSESNIKGWVTNKEISAKDSLFGRLIKLVPPVLFEELMKRHYYRAIKSITEKQLKDLKIGRFLVDRHDYVIDIGANIGTYTKILSKWVGYSGRVYSIEPIPSTYRYLIYNIDRLHLQNVHPCQCAISDTVGMLNLSVPRNKFGLENHYRAQVSTEPIGPSSKTYQIKSNTIDKMLSKNQRQVTFIKIDTEEHELPCIKGARETISRWRPALLLEISSDFTNKKSDGYQLKEILKEYGYQPFIFDGVSISKWYPGERRINYFFLTLEHIDRLRRQNPYSISNG